MGHIISIEVVQVDQRKTEAVKYWPRALDPPNIRSFLGLAAYYRRFINGFSSLAYSLTTLTQKNVRFEW